MGVRDFVDADVTPFMIRTDRDGQFHSWQLADVAGVMDLLSGQDYDAAIGEQSDTIMVFRLTVLGLTPVVVKQCRHEAIGFVEVILTWPGVSGVTESGSVTDYFKIVEA